MYATPNPSVGRTSGRHVRARLTRPPRGATVSVLAVLVLAGGGSWFAHRRPAATARLSRPTWHREDPLAPAREALAVRRFAEAQRYLRRYLEANPRYAEAHYLLAQTCRRTGDFDGWRRHLEQAEAAGASVPLLEQERHLYGLQTGRVRGLNAVLENYLDRHPPEEVLILELLVQSYLEHNLLPDVVRLTGLWIERHPEDPLAYLDRGRARLILQRDQPTAAVQDFQRALELNPDLAEARLALARTCVKERRWSDALEQFQAVLRQHAGDQAALLGVAECQLALSEPAAAREALDALPAKDRGGAAACFLRAKLDWVGGKPDDAIHWLKRAEAAAPSNLEIVHTLGLTSLQTDRRDEAERYHRRFDELDRQQAQLAALAVQILKDPHDAGLRYRAAVVNLEFGRDREAENCLQAALWLDPNHRPSLTAYADLLAKQGRSGLAAQLRRKLHESNGGTENSRP
jgi:tetratricopeptide (TPR) repeat protein